MSRPRPFPSWIPAAGLGLLMTALAGLAGFLIWNPHGVQSVPDPDRFQVASLVDPDGRGSLDEIRGRPEGDWRTWDGRQNLEAQAGAALWVRVTLRNSGATTLHGVLEDSARTVDRLEAWTAGPGGWGEEVAGDALAAADRPWWTNALAFTIEVPARGERVVYLRSTDYFGVFSHWQWWPRLEDFFSAQFREVLAKGLWFGLLTGLLIYNTAFWLRLRFPDTTWYLGYSALLLVFNLALDGAPALVGGGVAVFLGNVIVAAAAAAAVPCLIAFARLFLETASRMPRLDRGLRGVQVLWIVILVAVPTQLWVGLAAWRVGLPLGMAATHVLLLAAAITAWRNGLRPARFFVAGCAMLMAGGVPSAISILTDGSMQPVGLFVLIGSTLEALMFSLALADRAATVQRRLDEETRQRRAIEEAYADELAVEVRERTHELAAANTDKDRMLTVIGHDLRGPLAGLTQTAELLGHERGSAAELEQFARDAAGVGRQTLLLIEDLVLWARLRTGLRQPPGPHPVWALVTPVVALHRASAGQRGIRLAVTVPDGLRVETDLVLAQTLLRNLVANALKFARTEVAVTVTPTERGVRLSVADDGPGLPAAVATALAGESAPAGPEGGLGLRLCVEIGRALGVSLAAHLREGGGTEFTFVLPPAPGGETHS